MSSKTFRPGQFGIFSVLEEGSNLDEILTRALPSLASLHLKSVQWIDLGSRIRAILFSSFRAQIYLQEWKAVFKGAFQNSVDDDRLRDNSKRVVKMLADARQLNALCINHFEVNIITPEKLYFLAVGDGYM